MTVKVWSMFAVAAVLATLALYPSHRDMTLTTDGVNYLSIAENVAKFKGVHNYSGQVELVHPFGYSLALVPFIWLGLPAQSAALAVNWLSLVAVGLLAFLILRELTGLDDWRITAGAGLVMLCPPLVIFANWILSETLCAALALLFIWRCMKGDKPWLTLLVGLALCFTRYTGLAVVLGAGLFLRTWKDRAIVVLPPLALAGVIFALFKGVKSYFTINDLRPGNIGHVPLGIEAIIAGGVVLFVLIGLVVKDWKLPAVRSMAGAVVAYAGGLAATTILYKIDPTMDLRLFVPIAGILLVLLIGLWIRQVSSLKTYLIAGLAYFLVGGLITAWPTMTNENHHAFNSTAFKTAPVMALIDSLPANTPIYSTCPAGIWSVTGRVTKALRNHIYQDHQTVQAAMDEPRKTGGYLIWFKVFNGGYAGPQEYLDLMWRNDKGQVWYTMDDDVALVVPVRAVQ